jgi:hypothetical protein
VPVKRPDNSSGELHVRHVPGDVIVGFYYDSTIGDGIRFNNNQELVAIHNSLRDMPRVKYDADYVYQQKALSSKIPKGRFKFVSNSSIKESGDELEYHYECDFSKSEEPFGVIKVTK